MGPRPRSSQCQKKQKRNLSRYCFVLADISLFSLEYQVSKVISLAQTIRRASQDPCRHVDSRLIASCCKPSRMCSMKFGHCMFETTPRTSLLDGITPGLLIRITIEVTLAAAAGARPRDQPHYGYLSSSLCAKIRFHWRFAGHGGVSAVPWAVSSLTAFLAWFQFNGGSNSSLSQSSSHR